MELLLVRHAQPERVDDGLEPADPGLTPAGLGQAQQLAKAFAAGAFGPVDAIVSSSMLRARQTAEPVAETLGLTARTDERLAELDLGWTTYGAELDNIPSRRAAYDELNAGRWGPDTYDPGDFAARVRAGVEDVVTGQPHGTVAVVCHGGVISAYLANVVGAARMLFLVPDHCSVTRVLAERDGYREVLSVNESLHMRTV
ncbi:MAG: histidine phosphatase family protein [Actinomycetia bacterium]|nr:histidine phosphatase family protein [Actinomycetes bacterium]